MNNRKLRVTRRSPNTLFGMIVPKATLEEIYSTHVKLHIEKPGCSGVSICSTSQDLAEFEGLYITPAEHFKAEYLQNAVRFEYPYLAYLDTRHIIRGESIHRLDKYQYKRHKADTQPSGAITVEVKGECDKWRSIEIEQGEGYTVLKTDELFAFKPLDNKFNNAIDIEIVNDDYLMNRNDQEDN